MIRYFGQLKLSFLPKMVVVKATGNHFFTILVNVSFRVSGESWSNPLKRPGIAASVLSLL